MDRYQKVKNPRPEQPIGENEILITSQGLIRNYISYATSLLQEKRVEEIVLKAMGQAISKTVAVAEIIKGYMRFFYVPTREVVHAIVRDRTFLILEFQNRRIFLDCTKIFLSVQSALLMSGNQLKKALFLWRRLDVCLLYQFHCRRETLTEILQGTRLQQILSGQDHIVSIISKVGQQPSPTDGVYSQGNGGGGGRVRGRGLRGRGRYGGGYRGGYSGYYDNGYSSGYGGDYDDGYYGSHRDDYAGGYGGGYGNNHGLMCIVSQSSLRIELNDRRWSNQGGQGRNGGYCGAGYERGRSQGARGYSRGGGRLRGNESY